MDTRRKKLGRPKATWHRMVEKERNEARCGHQCDKPLQTDRDGEMMFEPYARTGAESVKIKIRYHTRLKGYT